jgi:hypothetical protein
MIFNENFQGQLIIWFSIGTPLAMFARWGLIPVINTIYNNKPHNGPNKITAPIKFVVGPV